MSSSRRMESSSGRSTMAACAITRSIFFQSTSAGRCQHSARASQGAHGLQGIVRVSRRRPQARAPSSAPPSVAPNAPLGANFAQKEKQVQLATENQQQNFPPAWRDVTQRFELRAGSLCALRASPARLDPGRPSAWRSRRNGSPSPAGTTCAILAQPPAAPSGPPPPAARASVRITLHRPRLHTPTAS